MAPIATPTKDTQVFASGDVNHRIVRVPQNEVDAGQGRAHEVYPALAYEFVEGMLIIDDAVRERDREYFKKWKKKLDFGAVQYAKPDLPAEEWLREHSSLGIGGGWGFHEIAGAVADTVQRDLADALLEGDSEKLVELYTQEESGAARDDVLDQIKRALEKLETDTAAAAG